MSAAPDLLHELTDKGVHLDVRGERLHVESPPGVITPELRQKMTSHKAELLVLLASDLCNSLKAATVGLSITPDDLRAELSADDMDDWRAGAIGPDNLRALAQAMQDGRDRQAGRIPACYDEIATCKRCGPVWLFIDGTVETCPWCINRMAGWPIPRPSNVACGDCRHFWRTEHPHLGRCGAGLKPDNPTGRWWGSDRHGCSRWLSIDKHGPYP